MPLFLDLFFCKLLEILLLSLFESILPFNEAVDLFLFLLGRFFTLQLCETARVTMTSRPAISFACHQGELT